MCQYANEVQSNDHIWKNTLCVNTCKEPTYEQNKIIFNNIICFYTVFVLKLM